jgi:photosystem II stability/assembly factor-like uncharacterized protein
VIRRIASVLAVCLLFSITAPAAADGIDPELLAGMKARSIGPAGMSGRTAAVDAVHADPDIIYVATATGGVWKSVNGGLNWKPIFDDQPVAATGAVAIFQPSPDVVWVGTGEGNPRNSVSVGNGIYRTLDAGRTWKHLGLEESERIHRIILHPSDPDTAWVCAMGKAWGENEQRGVFRTDDGGDSWEKILYVDERTGCADLAQDPGNPEKFIAAMWDYRRWPWFFRSGGPGSGLHVTVDGGKTWKQYTPEDGMPEGELGRIGVAFAPSNPEIVYALVEAEENIFMRSEDGGHSWKKMETKGNFGNRPFYYADLRVDPELADRVYSLHSIVTVSDDGGRSFRTLIPFLSLHPDHHGMWINPNDPTHIIATNDGGVGISRDRGATWRFVRNLPLAQFYHIRVDNDYPYHVFGGMQDNGSWRGPSSVWEGGLGQGIRNFHWQMVDFGDGFDTLPDPEDSMKGYAMSQGGYISRWDMHTGEVKDIRPPDLEETKLRFNWNAGIAQDPFDTGTVYYGSQFVHKSTDRGMSWQVISADLTSNNPDWQKQDESGGLTLDVTAAENFTSIVTIEPSIVQKGVIWVGTDDGRIHVTQDGGGTWSSVEGSVKGVPENTWVPHITPSKFDAGTAFAVFDNHRRSDINTYAYKTSNFGKSWAKLSTEGVRGYALKIEQDHIDKDLLFLGTEFGLYWSVDGGGRWLQWSHGFPTVSAMDMVIHPRESDLVVGTHGRAAFIIDDISPLRNLSAAVLDKPLHLFKVAAAQQYQSRQSPGELIPGASEFRGANRPYGALITFSVSGEGIPHPDEDLERERKQAEREKNVAEAARKKEEAGEEKESEEGSKEDEGEDKDDDSKSVEAEIRVTDGSGKLIRKWKEKVHLGINRVEWNLSHDAFKRPSVDPYAGLFGGGGADVLPGDYTVTIDFRDQEVSGSIKVLSDPRFSISRADREAKHAAVMKAGQAREVITQAVRQIQRTRSDIDAITMKLKARDADADTTDDKKSPQKALIKAGGKLKKSLSKLENNLWQGPDTKGIPPDDDVFSKFGTVLYMLQSSWDKPTSAQLTTTARAEKLLEEVFVNFNKMFETEVAEFRAKANEAGLDLLPKTNPLAMD